MQFFFFESLAESRQVLSCIAVQIQFIVNNLIDIVGVLFVVGKSFLVSRFPDKAGTENRVITVTSVLRYAIEASSVLGK